MLLSMVCTECASCFAKAKLHDFTASRALATNSTGELDVLGHDCHALGMDGAQVGVFKESNKVGLGRLLQRDDSCGLES